MNNKGIFFLTVCTLLLLPHVAQAASSSDPALGNPVSAVLSVLFPLLLIIALAIFSIRFLARKSRVATKGAIRVLAARQIAPNRSVQVIAIEGKRYLIGVGNEVTLLADVTGNYPDFDGTTQGTFPEHDFSKTLAQALQSVRQRYKDLGRKEAE